MFCETSNENGVADEFTITTEDEILNDGALSGKRSENVCRGYNAEATLTLRFSMDSLDEKPRTEKVLVADHLYWYLYVTRTAKDNVDYLTAYACTKDMYKYPMEYEVQYTLEAHDSDKSIQEHAKSAYDQSGYHLYGRRLADCDQLGFCGGFRAADGMLTVTAQIKSRLPRCFNFYDGDPISDIRIKIGGVSFPFIKAVLALHSPFFKAMFFGQFKEANQNEVTLPDVDRVAFVNLISALVIRRFELKPVHVRSVLELADRFGMITIVNLCGMMLLNHDSAPLSTRIAETLVLAITYKLFHLQERCLTLCDSVEIARDVMASQHYKDVPDAIKIRMLERVA